MATMWKRAMLYLGLGPDEEYEDDDAAEAPAARYGTGTPAEAANGAVRPPPRERQAPEPAPAPAPAPAPVPTTPSRPSAVVRPITPPPSSKPYAVSPASFNDAQEVADRFLASTPVIMNLEGVSKELSRRLVDFASGLCYGTRGQMEKVTTSVYLLTPTDAEVSAEDRRKLQHGGG